MKNNNDKEDNNLVNKIKIKSSTIKNFKTKLITRNINRNKSPQCFNKNNMFKKSLTKENNSRKKMPKINSNYEGSLYNINSLIAKMNSLKKLMYKTTDLNSMLAMDKYGLKYAYDLKRNINSANKLMSPLNQESKNNNNYDINNLNYFQEININKDYLKQSRRFEKELKNLSKDFDLTNSINVSNLKKEKIKDVLEEEKKDKKLYHLKTELFLLDQNNKIKDSYISESKLNKNLTFIRDNTMKDNIYCQIKSKYLSKNHNKNKRKRTLLLTLNNTNNFSELKNSFKNTFNEKSEIIKVNENEEDNNFNVEKNGMSKHKIFLLKNKMNSYNTKIQNSIKNINNNLNKNQKIFNYDLKIQTPLPTSPNLTLSNNIRPIKSKNIKKLSLYHLTNSNNSKENSAYNSPNSSLNGNDMIYPKFKNIIKITKNNTNKNNISLKNLKKHILNPRKFFLMKKINNIMNKSNSIKKSFINTSDEIKELKKKLFSKYDYKYKLNKDLNINLDQINKYFKFSKRDDIDEIQLIRDNANKVKTIMDNKCSKLLDSIVNELLYQDRKLNKQYLGLSSYEKKILKIQREDDIKKIGNEHAFNEKAIQKDKILDIFLSENQEIIDLLKENNNKNRYDDIELLYIKSKVLKHLKKK